MYSNNDKIYNIEEYFKDSFLVHHNDNSINDKCIKINNSLVTQFSNIIGIAEVKIKHKYCIEVRIGHMFDIHNVEDRITDIMNSNNFIHKPKKIL